MNVHQEEDYVPSKRIALALTVTFGLIIVCLIWVWAVMVPLEAKDAGKPRTLGARQVVTTSPVDRTLYTWQAGFAAELFARKHTQLEGWSWVDKKDGVVRIPIEKAMQIIVEEGQR